MVPSSSASGLCQSFLASRKKPLRTSMREQNKSLQSRDCIWLSVDKKVAKEGDKEKHSGQLARVPALEESFVYWTRLSVKPAKIMQAAPNFSLSLSLSLSLSHTHTHTHTLSHSINQSLTLHTYGSIEGVRVDRNVALLVHSLSVKNVVLYLKACNNMFERGILY